MKVTLILAQSIDGFIAKNLNDDLSWRSVEDRRFFYKKSMQIKNVIIGSRTYKNMPPKVFESRNWLVFTRSPEQYEEKNNIRFFNGNAQEAISYFEEQGSEEVLVAGGSEIFNMFINEDIFTDILITISPVILGNGIRGISPDKMVNLKLKEVIKLNNQEVLLHYSK